MVQQLTGLAVENQVEIAGGQAKAMAQVAAQLRGAQRLDAVTLPDTLLQLSQFRGFHELRQALVAHQHDAGAIGFSSVGRRQRFYLCQCLDTRSEGVLDNDEHADTRVLKLLHLAAQGRKASNRASRVVLDAEYDE